MDRSEGLVLASLPSGSRCVSRNSSGDVAERTAPPRVLLFRTPIHHGEVYFRAQQTAALLRRMKCDVRVIPSRGKMGFLNDLARWPSLLARSDIVFLYPHPLLALFAGAAVLRRRSVVIDHFVSYIRTRDAVAHFHPPDFVERSAYRRATMVLAHTESVAQELTTAWELDSERVATVYAVVDTDHFSPVRHRAESSDLRSTLGLSDRFTVFYHGKLHPWHGVSVLREAVSRLVADGIPISLVLLGRSGLGLPHEVWIDSVPYWDLPPYIQLADLWCSGFANQPRGDRSFGSTMIQALSMARPVVTSPSPEKNRFLVDSVNAAIVPPDDPGTLARAINLLRQDSERRRAIGEAGRELAIRAFGEEQFVGALRRVCGWTEEGQARRGSA